MSALSEAMSRIETLGDELKSAKENLRSWQDRYRQLEQEHLNLMDEVTKPVPQKEVSATRVVPGEKDHIPWWLKRNDFSAFERLAKRYGGIGEGKTANNWSLTISQIEEASSDAATRRHIFFGILKVLETPQTPKIFKKYFSGNQGANRCRQQGDWRILYNLNQKGHPEIVRIEQRKEVYGIGHRN